MARNTYPSSGTTRTVLEKGDVRDVITNVSPDKHPILSLMRVQGAQDTQPKSVEDTLASAASSNSYAHTAAAPASVDTTRTTHQNDTQRMLKTVQVTHAQNAVAQYGMGNEVEYQKAKKLVEIMRDGENVLISDQARQQGTQTNGYEGQMAGLSNLISTNTNATFSQANWDTLVAAIVGTYKASPSVAFMDSTRKIAVDAWTTNVTRYESEHTRLDKQVLVYQSDLGPAVSMLFHDMLPNDIVGAAAHVLLLDMEHWARRDLIALRWMELADTGAGQGGYWEWEWTLDELAEQASGQFDIA